jgi:hypothetical protein
MFASNLYSIQLWMIIIITIGTFGFVIMRFYDFPKINRLNKDINKNLFDLSIQGILALFAGFSIAITIIYGNLYAKAMGETNFTGYLITLQHQGIIWLSFISVLTIIFAYTFIWPLLRKMINDHQDPSRDN